MNTPETPTGTLLSSTDLFGIRPLKWEKIKNRYMESCRASVPMGSYIGMWDETREVFDFEFFELNPKEIKGWLPAPEWKEEE